MSARSAPLPSGWSSAWNARVWMSSRWGMGMPGPSFANDNNGSVFVMSRPQRKAKGPTTPEPCGSGGGAGGSNRRAGVWPIRACRRTKEDLGTRPAGPNGPRCISRRLLQFDDGALRLTLLSDFLGFLLGHAFLHGPRSALDQVLGFLETQARDRPDFLDDLDLLLAGALQHDGELRLLLG